MNSCTALRHGVGRCRGCRTARRQQQRCKSLRAAEERGNGTAGAFGDRVHRACSRHRSRYGTKPAAELGSQIGDLIVASMPSCITPVRAMIDAYDRYYGEGTGEAFFMGPYLDVLPNAVVEAGKKAAR